MAGVVREGAHRVHDDEDRSDCALELLEGAEVGGQAGVAARRDEGVNEDAVAEVRGDEKQVEHDT